LIDKIQEGKITEKWIEECLSPECKRQYTKSELSSQQSPVEAEHVISKLTIENDVVLDPLMCSGTTGIAAINLRRQFVGIEQDPEVFKMAKARIDKLSYHIITYIILLQQSWRYSLNSIHEETL
jgi:DNA modification methylase